MKLKVHRESGSQPAAGSLACRGKSRAPTPCAKNSICLGKLAPASVKEGPQTDLEVQLLAFSLQAFSENLCLIKCFLQATSRIPGVLSEEVLLGFRFQLHIPELVYLPAAPCRLTPVTWMRVKPGKVGGEEEALAREPHCEPGRLSPCLVSALCNPEVRWEVPALLLSGLK